MKDSINRKAQREVQRKSTRRVHAIDSTRGMTKHLVEQRRCIKCKKQLGNPCESEHEALLRSTRYEYTSTPKIRISTVLYEASLLVRQLTASRKSRRIANQVPMAKPKPTTKDVDRFECMRDMTVQEWQF